MSISGQFQVSLNLVNSAGHILWQMNVEMNPADVNLGGVESSTPKVVVQRVT